MKSNSRVYHCIFNRKVKIFNISQVNMLFAKGFFIKEVYHGPEWAPATYFYLGKH